MRGPTYSELVGNMRGATNSELGSKMRGPHEFSVEKNFKRAPTFIFRVGIKDTSSMGTIWLNLIRYNED